MLKNGKNGKNEFAVFPVSLFRPNGKKWQNIGAPISDDGGGGTMGGGEMPKTAPTQPQTFWGA